MTSNELRRWLARHGCMFVEGKRHTLVILGGKSAPLPRHGKRELPRGTVEGILKQLGLTGGKE